MPQKGSRKFKGINEQEGELYISIKHALLNIWEVQQGLNSMKNKPLFDTSSEAQ